jgi:hypothetical protein
VVVVLRTLLTVLLFSLVVALTACGGNDESQVKQTVREFVKATSERDADKWCGKLVTHEFLEQATGATGSKAKDVCRRQLKTAKAPDLRLIRIGKPKIKGDKATVITGLEEQGQPRPQVFRLKKEDGDWRITSGGAG